MAPSASNKPLCLLKQRPHPHISDAISGSLLQQGRGNGGEFASNTRRPRSDIALQRNPPPILLPGFQVQAKIRQLTIMQHSRPMI